MGRYTKRHAIIVERNENLLTANKSKLKTKIFERYDNKFCKIIEVEFLKKANALHNNMRYTTILSSI